MGEAEHEYRKHRIRIPEGVQQGQPYVEIRGTAYLDDEPVQFGQDGAGRYYLEPYAYDRHASLLEVLKRFVDHREGAAESAKSESPTEGDQ